MFLLEFHDKRGTIDDSFEMFKSLANANWNRISKEERISYKTRAEKVGFSQIDSRVEDIIKLFRGISNKKLQKNIVKINQSSLYLTTAFERNWEEEVFVFAHVNYRVKIKDQYYPNEIGLLKFSLDQGILETLHFHLDPGTLPIGYVSEANYRAEKTHQIPFDSKMGIPIQSAKDQILSFMDIKKDKQSYVFTLTEEHDLPAAKNMFEMITQDGQVGVIALESLVSKYNLHCKHEKIDPVQLIDILINKNEWEKDDIGCAFHSDLDIPRFCSLAK